MTTKRTKIWLGTILFVFGFETFVLASDEEPAAKSKPTVQRILEVCDLVVDRHVEPPVRQQLVLLAARSIYETQKKPAPRELSGRVSELSKTDEFKDLLDAIVADVGEVDSNAVIEDLLSRIPGGGTLVAGQEAKVRAQVTANQYVGVGIALSMKGDRPLITTSFYGGPGHRAGVKNQDVILEIDGKSTAGKPLGQVVTELRGAAGSDVTLLLKHPTAGERELVVTRNVTFIPTIHGASQDDEGKWNYRLPAHPDLALFRLDSFGASTVHELRKLDSELSGAPLKGIILDLRRGGGQLHHVVMVADQFLEAGVIGSTTAGDAETTHKSEAGCLFEGVPMVVLTSKSSSASSVFLAAALQDRGRAIVVGEPTNGASYVRSQLDLTNGDKVIIPTGYIRRSNGTVLFAKQNPMFATQVAAELARDKDLDRKSANVVVPNHVVLDNLPQASAMTDHPKPSTDAILAKAVAVLQKHQRTAVRPRSQPKTGPRPGPNSVRRS